MEEVEDGKDLVVEVVVVEVVVVVLTSDSESKKNRVRAVGRIAKTWVDTLKTVAVK